MLAVGNFGFPSGHVEPPPRVFQLMQADRMLLN